MLRLEVMTNYMWHEAENDTDHLGLGPGIIFDLQFQSRFGIVVCGESPQTKNKGTSILDSTAKPITV